MILASIILLTISIVVSIVSGSLLVIATLSNDKPKFVFTWLVTTAITILCMAVFFIFYLVVFVYHPYSTLIVCGGVAVLLPAMGMFFSKLRMVEEMRNLNRNVVFINRINQLFLVGGSLLLQRNASNNLKRRNRSDSKAYTVEVLVFMNLPYLKSRKPDSTLIPNLKTALYLNFYLFNFTQKFCHIFRNQ